MYIKPASHALIQDLFPEYQDLKHIGIET
jgi:hypothetical protein